MADYDKLNKTGFLPEMERLDLAGIARVTEISVGIADKRITNAEGTPMSKKIECRVAKVDETLEGRRKAKRYLS